MVLVVMHPREHVRDVLCERTHELAPFMAHIESATLISRHTVKPDLVCCVHQWLARPNVPALLAHHVDKDFLEWHARTEWRTGEFENRWSVAPKSLGDQALCRGTMGFTSAVGGRGTRIELELELLAPQQTAALRTFSRAMLSLHFRKLGEAAARLLNGR